MSDVNSSKVVPFLWFDNNAEEAVKFYTSVFKNSKIVQLTPMVSTFEIEGLRVMAINGGPPFKFSEAVSFFVNCDTQEEVDYYWEKLLSGGGKESQCGWLKDKYGLSWQIVPKILGELMSDPDAAKRDRVMQAMLKMVKFDIAALRKAHAG